MEQKIIEKLRSELNDTYWCKNDFEKYDIESFEGKDEPFFFSIRENGTSLLFIGPSLEYYLKDEANRFRVMRNPEWIVTNLLYYREDGIKYFYYDGYILHSISKEDIETIFKNIWGWRFNRLAEEYPEEFELKDVSPKIVMNDFTQNKMDEALHFAAEKEDQSLVKILNRFRSKERMAVDHEIWIYEEGGMSFYFEERMNGERVMNGGIIFHKESTGNGRWSVHT